MDLPKCELCRHPKRLEIQKAIDDGYTLQQIEDKFGIKKYVTAYHNRNNHREKLLAWVAASRYAIKDGIDTAEILIRFVKKWAEQLEKKKVIKNSDALKAIEQLNRLQGKFVEKHEVTVKKELGEVIKEYLDNCSNN